MNRLPEDTLVVGLDAGGTYTSVCARTLSNATDLFLKGPAANARRHGAEHTASVLADLVDQAISQRPDYTLRAVFAGVAGAGQPDIAEAVVEHLKARLASHSPCQVTVTHDGVIALEAALAGRSGLLIIAGTGSAIFARTHERRAVQIGGWGPIMGDEGSGYAIGRDGLAGVAHAMDGGPSTSLVDLMKRQFQLSTRPSILEAVYERQWPLQQLAPLVLQAASENDPVSVEIIDVQTRALAMQASWLLEKHSNIGPRYTVCGGLSQSPYYLSALRAHMQRAWPEATWGEPIQKALEGAVELGFKSLSDLISG